MSTSDETCYRCGGKLEPDEHMGHRYYDECVNYLKAELIAAQEQERGLRLKYQDTEHPDDIRARAVEVDRMKIDVYNLQKQLASANTRYEVASSAWDMANKRAEQAEAQAAAMRETLIMAREYLLLRSSLPKRRTEVVDAVDQVEAALSSTAGADLLRRVTLSENALRYIATADMTRKEIRKYTKGILDKLLFEEEGGEK